MKKHLLVLILSLAVYTSSFGQIICLFCFDQNDSISSNVNNLVLNGGFENTTCIAGGGSVFCPASASYNCNISNWTCTGGGTNTYAQMFDNNMSIIVEGTKAAYLGNAFCQPCSATPDDTTCIIRDSCGVQGLPNGYPVNDAAYGGTNGVSIEQTVNGLIIGRIYILEFWSGGEGFGFFVQKGVFGLDLGFGQIMLSNKPSTANSSDIGTRFIVEFRATSTSHTIKFTNWGHICSNCTEAVFDNVRLYPFADLSNVVPPCDTGGVIVDPPPIDPPPVVIPIVPKDSLYIPNIFTPNNQSANDLYKVFYNGTKEYNLTILNRWGDVAFKSSDKSIYWDGKIRGKEASDGTYYYILLIGDQKYTGFLTLLR